jgi:hypothetical protein
VGSSASAVSSFESSSLSSLSSRLLRRLSHETLFEGAAVSKPLSHENQVTGLLVVQLCFFKCARAYRIGKDRLAREAKGLERRAAILASVFHRAANLLKATP